MIRLFDIVIGSNYSLKNKVTFLNACSNSGSFPEDDANCIGLVTRKIKALLSSSTDRTEGLLLLKTFLSECSVEVLLENTSSWVMLILKIIQGAASVEDKRIACLVLQDLFLLLPSFQSIWKRVAESMAPSLLDSLLRIAPDDEWFEEAVDLLACLMKVFPGLCGPSKLKIESFILKHMDSWNEHIIESLASCVALLPFCGGGGNQSANHSAAWEAQLENLLKSLDRILDHLYHDIDINEDGSALLLSSLELAALPSSDPLLSIYCLHKHYQFLGQCLLQMLNSQSAFPVSLPLEELISHIWKALSINSLEMLEKKSVDAVAIASVIPTIHCVALSILESLIYGFGPQLSLHFNTVNHLLLQSLEWTTHEDATYGSDKPYSGVRIQTYQVLQLWIESLGSLSAVYKQGEAFVKHFLLDLRAEPDSVQLQSPSGSDRPRGKKRKLKQQTEMVTNALSQKKINKLANRELCWEALAALKCLLYSSGGLMELEVHKQIHGVIVPLLATVQQHAHNEESPGLLIPYSNASCRQRLYEVLLACVLNPHPQWPPPLPSAVSLFMEGKVDPNIQVSARCTEGLAALNALMHPCVSILQYTIKEVETPLSRSHSMNIGVESLQRGPTISQTQHSHQQQHMMEEDEEEDLKYEPAYVQPVRNQKEKEDVSWRLKEQNINIEQQRPVVIEASHKLPTLPQISQIPLAQPQKHTQQPPINSQLSKVQPLTQHVQQQQPPVQKHKAVIPAPRKNRGAEPPSDDVVCLSEEDSAEEHHEEEDDDEEDEEDDYYPEDEEEEGEYRQENREAAYYPTRKSPTGGRSAEDSSSTVTAVNSIVGNLVQEAASTINPPSARVQKARRTGIPVGRQPPEEDLKEEEEEDEEDEEEEDDDEEIEEGQIQPGQSREEEDELYDHMDYEEEEEVHGGYSREEYDEDNDDIQEIGDEDENEVAQRYVEERHRQEWLKNDVAVKSIETILPEPQELPSIINITSNLPGVVQPCLEVVHEVERLQPIPELSVLQNMGPAQTVEESLHSKDIIPEIYPTPAVIINTTLIIPVVKPTSSPIPPDVSGLVDETEAAHIIPLEAHPHPDAVEIELFDSPVKDCQTDIASEMPPTLTAMPSVEKQLPESEPPELEEQDIRCQTPVTSEPLLEDEPEVLNEPENVEVSDTEDKNFLAANSIDSAAWTNEAQTTVIEGEEEAEIKDDVYAPGDGDKIDKVVSNGGEVLPDVENVPKIKENNVNDVNHSTEDVNNYADDEYYEEEGMEEEEGEVEECEVVSSSSAPGVLTKRIPCISPERSPDQPAAKKMCLSLEEAVEEEDSPVLEDMINDFTPADP